MEKFLIRTNKNEKRTYIAKAGNLVKLIALTYTDFKPRLGISKDITDEEIINPENKKPLAHIQLYQDNDLITIRQKRENLFSIKDNGTYEENGKKIAIRKVNRAMLPKEECYTKMASLGLTHAYFIDNSPLSIVYCFEREGDISGIVYSKDSSIESVLGGLALVLAKRIEDNELIFKFMKK